MIRWWLISLFFIAYIGRGAMFLADRQSLNGYWMILGVLMVIPFLRGFRSPIFRNRWASFLIWAIWMIFIAEIAVYSIYSSGRMRADLRFWMRGYQASSAPLVSYDTIRGYRPLPGQVRYTSIHQGITEIDHIVHINANHCYANIPYSYRKENPEDFRWILLGDSYSSGLVAPVPWPTRWLETSVDYDPKIQLYNFSADGFGIINWYRLFFMEIIPHYDFDGVILALSHEKNAFPNLDRRMILGHSTPQQSLITLLDWPEDPLPMQFPTQHAAPLAEVASSEVIEQTKQQYLNNQHHWKALSPDFYGLTSLLGWLDGFRRFWIFSRQLDRYQEGFNRRIELSQQTTDSLQLLKTLYPKSWMLEEILTYCRNQNKQIRILTIPDYLNSVDGLNQQPIDDPQLHQWIATRHQGTHVNGFNMWADLPPDLLAEFYHRHDQHWNQKGIDRWVEFLHAHQVLCP